MAREPSWPSTGANGSAPLSFRVRAPRNQRGCGALGAAHQENVARMPRLLAERKRINSSASVSGGALHGRPCLLFDVLTHH